MHYIHKGGRKTRRFYRCGYFLCLYDLYHTGGPVPPCGALMRPLPLWCSATGKAGPFFYPCLKLK